MNSAGKVLFVSAIILLLGTAVWYGYARERQQPCSDDPYNANLNLPDCKVEATIGSQNVLPSDLPQITISSLGSPKVFPNTNGEAILIKSWSIGDQTQIVYTVYHAQGQSLEQFVKSYKAQHNVVDFKPEKKVTVAGKQTIQLEGDVDFITVSSFFASGKYVLELSLVNPDPDEAKFREQYAKILSEVETNDSSPPTSSDEVYWNAYWDDLVSQAKKASTTTLIGEFTFSIPTSLLRQQVDSGALYTFNDVPEGPYISFQEVKDTPETIVAGIKNSLSEFERIVLERQEPIDGVLWSMIQQTTDFGIDQVTWAATQTNNTMKVFYTVTRPETTDVFEGIVRSARKSS